jgi:DNA-binding NtrC family response regulator
MESNLDEGIFDEFDEGPGPHQDIAHLCVLSERLPQSIHVLPSKSTSIGRVGGGCDITIHDGFVSRWHILIEGSSEGWQLRDLGSSNGGFIDGHRFGPGERMALTDGTVIRLGKTLMVFRASAPISDGQADSHVFPGTSPVAVAQRRRIDALASGSGHVLILGEAGTGKVRVARAIGEYGAPHPFVAVNCTELSGDLARSVLFGHVGGQYPAETSGKPGLIGMAGDGVLFLDEIVELSLDAQGELRAFLETGAYWPLGSTEARHSRARVVAATHLDLFEAVKSHRLRRDLFAILRAKNAPLKLPPLRERREDILGWTQLFLRQGNRDPGLNPWTVDALESLLLYPWTKNLRELGPVVMGAAAQSPSFPLGVEHLPAELRAHREALRASPRPTHYPSRPKPR